MVDNTGVGQRTAVVTGAGSPRSIGAAAAHRYAREGWAVALLDLDPVSTQQVAEEIRAEHGAPTLAFEANVTDAARLRAIAVELEASELPPVGSLANIAGIPSPVPFLEVTEDEWHRVLDVNLTGVFHACQAFLPAMIEHGYGRIVNMSSISAQQGGGVFSKTPYSAAKAGVLGLTRSLAREVAEHGITVNAIAPGVVDTNIRAGASDEENERRLSASVPLGRQARADEIAALCVWLSSVDAGYITGTTQSINGGVYMA